jgi:carboxypeptidase T
MEGPIVMRFFNVCIINALVIGCTLALPLSHLAQAEIGKDPTLQEEPRFIQVAAKNKEQRSEIANTGMSIEAVRSDSVWGFADPTSLKALRAGGFEILGNFDASVARGGHDTAFGAVGGGSERDFPPSDSRFHNYSELVVELNTLQAENRGLVKLQSIGKTIEGRDILAVHLNTSAQALETGQSGKPGVVFMGNHHAREHLSAEIPLMLIQYLLRNQKDPQISALLENRDIWIVPMVNPDGVEYDIAGGRYRSWRKNRKDNGDGTFGVDLNRNYGFKWGTGGSSTSTSSDVYMGKAPFSEPETQAVRDFVSAHVNTKVLLSFHTFSELILYPWGHKYDGIETTRDQQTFQKLASTMAQWNHYTPEQASDLYIASGDTTDWAYGTHGIFAFTFELSPKDMWSGGGFYPGQGVIDRVFEDNLRPALYLLEVADNPYKVLTQ